MSVIKRSIELEAPGHNCGKHVSQSEIMKCKPCKGDGYLMHQVNREEYDKKTCQVCQGSGYVVAEVEITFKPFMPWVAK